MTGSYGIYLSLARQVEAFLYDGDIKDRNGMFYVPEWLETAFKKGTLYFSSFKQPKKPGEAFIRCRGGSLLVKPGDYIVKDEDGQMFPVSKEQFERYYRWLEVI